MLSHLETGGHHRRGRRSCAQCCDIRLAGRAEREANELGQGERSIRRQPGRGHHQVALQHQVIVIRGSIARVGDVSDNVVGCHGGVALRRGRRRLRRNHVVGGGILHRRRWEIPGHAQRTLGPFCHHRHNRTERDLTGLRTRSVGNRVQTDCLAQRRLVAAGVCLPCAGPLFTRCGGSGRP